MKLAINRPTLAAAINQLNDRRQELLAMQSDEAYPGWEHDIVELRQDIQLVVHEIHWAASFLGGLDNWTEELNTALGVEEHDEQ